MTAKLRNLHVLTLALGCGVSINASVRAAEPTAEEDAIAKTAQAFIDAFQSGDAKAVASFWTADGDYIDDTGRVLSGRDEIEGSFAELFAENKGLKLRIDVDSLRIPAPGIAIEDGTSAVIGTDGSAPTLARYTNVLVNRDGKWLLSSVREAAAPGPSNYEFLRGLEWAIGEWVDDVPAEDALAGIGHISFDWAPGANFIVAQRTMDFNGSSQLQSTQWIAWDAAAKRIRSWNFQADGGFGEETWTRDGARWIINGESVLADGGKVAATTLITPVDTDTVSLKTTELKINGQAITDGKETKMKRIR